MGLALKSVTYFNVQDLKSWQLQVNMFIALGKVLKE